MKILSTILYTIFVTFVVGIAGLLLGSMLPIPGNIEMKIVKSGSMEPSIPTGSLVVVKPELQYRIGDVITFGKDTKTDIPTTHRIIAINDNGTYTVKGDANEEADPNRVERSTVIGKVIVHIPYVGFVLNFARQPIGFTLLIAIPAGLVILEEVITIIKETTKWYRRRRDDGDADGEEPGDLNGHLRKVFIRRNKMDEILMPMMLRPRSFSFAWWRHKLDLEKDSYGAATMLTLGLVCVSSLFAGASGGTLSYFQDLEKSMNNILQAGEWSPPVVAVDNGPTLSLLSLEDASTTGEVLGAHDDKSETESTDLPIDKTSSDAESTEEQPPADSAAHPQEDTPPTDSPPPSPTTTPESESTQGEEQTPPDVPPTAPSTETPPPPAAEPPPSSSSSDEALQL